MTDSRQRKYTDLRSGGPKTRPTIIFGSLVAAAFFGFGGVWSATATLSSAAIAEGQVAVEGNRKTVQHLEGGIVKAIHVKDGDTVAAGEVLVTLEDVQSKAAWQLLHGQQVALLALEARLVAERDGLPEIAFPPKLLELGSDAAHTLEGQRSIFDARKKGLETRREILNQRIVQLKEEISSLEKQVEATKKQRDLAAEERNGVAKLLKQGLATKPRLLGLDREISRLDSLQEEQQGSIAKARQEIGKTELEVVNVDADFRNSVVEELRRTQVEIADLGERLEAAADVQVRHEIRAPMAGTVVGLQIFTPGGVVRGGQTVLEIVPAAQALVVEANIRPMDIDDVAQGQGAEIRFSAFKSRTTPTLMGTVTYVSADSFTDQRSGRRFYTAKIAVPPEEIALLDGKDLTPGMPAEVMIVTGSRTPLDYLTAPIRESLRAAFRES